MCLGCSMSDVRVLGPAVERGDEILTDEALEFLAGLHESFAATRDELLEARKRRRGGQRPAVRLPETKHIRESREGRSLRCRPPVEITAPLTAR